MTSDTKAAPFQARSWLFAPGDSAKKMSKAADGPADIVLLDLEDSVVPESKQSARELVAEFLASREDRHRLWVRINPLTTPFAALDLAAVIAAGPGGVMLPKACGRADLDNLDQQLTVLEGQASIAQGSTKVAALVTETAAAMFKTGDYSGSPRLVAMSWGAEDLSSALGASEQFQDNGAYAPVFELARSLCLIGAIAAGVQPIETIQADFRDLEGLAKRAKLVRGSGYRGMLAIHPVQVEVINQAFTPTPEEIAHAQAIVDLFAANSGAGTIGLNGAMLDRPHLVLAQALLANLPQT
jgi:citrate lyase subunit beta/citryl-CoA lyase